MCAVQINDMRCNSPFLSDAAVVEIEIYNQDSLDIKSWREPPTFPFKSTFNRVNLNASFIAPCLHSLQAACHARVGRHCGKSRNAAASGEITSVSAQKSLYYYLCMSLPSNCSGTQWSNESRSSWRWRIEFTNPGDPARDLPTLSSTRHPNLPQGSGQASSKNLASLYEGNNGRIRVDSVPRLKMASILLHTDIIQNRLLCSGRTKNFLSPLVFWRCKQNIIAGTRKRRVTVGNATHMHRMRMTIWQILLPRTWPSPSDFHYFTHASAPHCNPPLLKLQHWCCVDT